MRIGILTIVFVLLTSCNTEIRFDSDEWNQKGVDLYMTDFREKIVDDLIESDTLIGLKNTEIIGLIGKPDYKNENEWQYLVREKYEWNIDPEYIKYLRVELDENGIATKCYIEKTK